MNFIIIIGYLAAFLTTISFIPQAWKIHKTKDTSSLSLEMFSLFTVGIALWMIYGILTVDIPVICANSITLLLSIYILTMKVKHR